MLHRTLSLVLVLFFLSSCQTIRDDERVIEERDQEANGITVGTPKVYDDSLLQQQLAAAEARLAGLQVIDQASIVAHLGAITGASQQISGVAVSALGLPTPGVTTTANGATRQTQEAATTTITSTAPVQNTATTMPQVTATAPGVPASSTTLPSGFTVSASDLLNEQLQLTAEIANLRLLLNGSLSDRLITNGTAHFVRPQLTVGFPIAITPEKRFRNAVAIVEVEVDTNPLNDFSKGGELPAVTALLPREKTYNVSAITDNTTSIGAGIVTQVASFGGSFLRARKTYYIVQDQDTLALLFQPRQPPNGLNRVGFSWQFRPVLGQDIVKAGLKQTFVQLAFPGSASDAKYGTVYERTYWRRYDRNHNLIGGIIPGSLNERYKPTPIPGFEIKMTQDVGPLNSSSLEDLGNGQMLVRLDGRFATGSAIRVGNNILQPGAGFSFDYNLIRFVAPIFDLATKRVALVSRDGTETPVRMMNDAIKPKGLTIEPPILTTIDESNSRLQIDTRVDPVENHPLVLVIGGKVFGYSDAPIQRAGRRLSVVLPTAFLAANNQVTVKPLLVDDRYVDTKPMFDQQSQTERLVLTEQTPKYLRYLLYGRRLDHMSVISPAGIQLHRAGSGVDAQNVRLIQLTPGVVSTVKALLVERSGERPFLIPIPALADPPKPAPQKQAPKFRERITVGADEAVIVGDNLADLVKVVALKQELTTFDRSADGKSVRVLGLAAAHITSTARTIDCDLVSKAGKTTIQLEVVDKKIESIPH